MGDKSFYELNIASASPTKLSSKGDESVSSDAPLVLPYFKPSKPFCGLWTLVATLTTSSIISYMVWHTNLFPKLVGQQLALRNGTQLFEAWSVEPVTTTFSIYLFNYTNVQEFESGQDSKLKIEEIGPFSYKVTTVKENIVFHNNGTLSYQDRKIYEFAPELTNGSLNDYVLVPNIPFLSALNQVSNSYAITRWMLGKALAQSDSPFISVKIDELIWGYDDRIFRISAQILKYQDQDIPFNKFGLWAGKNGTLADVITIYTGENDISKKGIISRFNGDRKLNHWGSDQCNRLDAYSGSAIAPAKNKNTIYLYTKDACRTIPLEFEHKMLTRGVFSYHYELPKDFLSNTGENECYCSGYCLPNGVLNASACAFGAPIMASKPHFLHGDPILYESIDGIQPDEKLHKTYIDIEPNLGLVVDGVTAAQMNIMLRNKQGMPINQNYPDMLILPVTWIKLSMDEFPSSLHAQFLSIVALFHVTQIIVYYAPILTLALCIIILVYRQFTRERFDKSIEQSIILESKA